MYILRFIIGIGLFGLLSTSAISQNIHPKTEAFVNYLDLSVNQVNRLQYFYPQYRGSDRVISIKEDLPDTFDVDIIGRNLYSELTSTIVSRHATEMATIIGGFGNTSKKGKGIATSVQFSSTNFENINPDPLNYFQSQGIKIQNHSYGFLEADNRYGSESRGYDQQMYDEPMLLHVMSAGNIGNTTSESGTYTGLEGYANISGSFKMAKNPILVSAIDEWGNVDARNSAGPAYDGRLKPEITAYGKDGTSDAAAMVSGVSILLQEAFETLEQSQIRSATLKSVLIASAVDVGAEGIDYQTGFGNMNAYRAMKILEQGYFMEDQLSMGQEKIFDIVVPANTTELRLAVSWTDLPNLEDASLALVNDLDITLENPSADKILPWVLSSYPHIDSLSKKATRREDHLNSTEFISLENPIAGTYTLKILGTDISEMPQNFSIAYNIEESDLFTWTYPLQDDVLEGSSEAIIRWESTESNRVVDIEYQLNDGTWESIGSESVETEYFTWSLPDTLSKALLRVIFDDNTIVESSSFFISPLVALNVESNCSDEVLLSWTGIENAESYQFFTIADGELIQLAETSDTLISLSTTNIDQEFIRMLPVFDNSPMTTSVGIEYTQKGVFCYYTNVFSRNVNNEYIQSVINLSTLINVESVIFERSIDGQSYDLLESRAITKDLYYEHIDQQPISEFSFYRISILLSTGELIVVDDSFVYFPFDSTFYIYPNPVKSGGYFTLLLKPNNQILKLYDLRGQLLKFWQINSEASEFDLPFIEKGIYLLNITEADGRNKTARIIIN